MQLADFIHHQPKGSTITVVAFRHYANECAVNVVNPVSGAVDAYHITGNEVQLCWNDELFNADNAWDDTHIVVDKGWVRYVVAQLITEDNRTFYRLHDDSVVDSLDPESVDMSWATYEEFCSQVPFNGVIR